MEALALWQKILLWFLPVLFAVTVHEIAHGYVALKYGDTTAKEAGRLSLNPLKHISPVGSVIVPALFILFSGFIFGWAKPVPVNQARLHKPKTDMALVAVAGPLSNLIMAILWALLMKVGIWLSGTSLMLAQILIIVGAAGVFINSALMMLNLLPFPPLDGGRILVGVLPKKYGHMISRIEPWGLPILLILIFSGLLGKIVWPMMMTGMAAATYISGLPLGLLSDALRVLFT